MYHELCGDLEGHTYFLTSNKKAFQFGSDQINGKKETKRERKSYSVNKEDMVNTCLFIIFGSGCGV